MVPQFCKTDETGKRKLIVTQNPLAPLESTGGRMIILMTVLGVGLFLVLSGNNLIGSELIGTAVAALLFLVLHK
jgi:hypothetical protein